MERGTGFGHEPLQRLAHLALVRRAARRLAVTDPGVDPRAELGEMDGRRHRIVRAERQREAGKVGIRGGEE